MARLSALGLLVWRMPVHVLAGGLALVYAWQVSFTGYVTTAVQFVSPLAVVMAVHFAWLGASGGLKPGFANLVLGRTLLTATGIAASMIVAAAFAPVPAEATNGSGSIFGDLMYLVCLLMIVAVMATAAGVIYFAFKILMAGGNWVSRRMGKPPGDDSNRTSDFASVALAFLVIGVASLEGLSGALSFATGDKASSSIAIDASPEKVWVAMGKATSPEFPLPAVLKIIPRPVAVLVDEGVALGARRVVHFTGREGAGDLELKVTSRDHFEVVFEAVSDSSPISYWVRQKALKYRVEAAGTGAVLTVSLSLRALRGRLEAS